MVNIASRKLGSWLVLANVLVFLVLLNLLAQQFFFRLDLTEEKRYTIAEPTRHLLRELDDVVYVDVYLQGDLPAGVKRLQRSIRETLEEFEVYAGNNLQFKFIDPSQATNTQARNEFYRSLAERGIQPTNLFDTDEEGNRVEKLIFPGAILSYGGRETPIMLLKGNKGVSPDEQLNQSIENVEYELASAIRKLTQVERKRIALIEGHDELDSLSGAGLSSALLEFYDVFRVNLPDKENLLGYDAIVVAKPRTAFSAQDKYKMDQFIMNGGKALFFLDALSVNMDSAGMGGTYAFPYELKLDDMLFRYGVRINKTFLQDMNAGAYPVVTGQFGDKPQIRLMPWPFFPVMNYYGNHPVVKNLDAVYGKFISDIDTVKATGIRKTPLIFTSAYSRILQMPVHVDLNDMRRNMRKEEFSQGPFPVAYLLEGAFTSLYKNRFLPEEVNTQGFREQGLDSKILVVADGDFVRNDINYENGEPYPLGFDPFLKTQFANKDLVLNALSYMLDEEGLIQAKAKEIKIRPLDKVKLKEEKLQWQIINLVLPVVVLIIFGIILYYVRKRRYSRF